MAAANEFQRCAAGDFLLLCEGDSLCLQRLAAPVRLSLPTPFTYPNNGPLLVFMVSDGKAVRLSEGGYLLRFLEGQGMDPSVDLIIGKTVFHALSEGAGAGIAGGQIYLDTTVDRVQADLPRFVQILLEVIGLRHSKYKDALVQLSRDGHSSTKEPLPLLWAGS
jgi:hypothetical protein